MLIFIPVILPAKLEVFPVNDVREFPETTLEEGFVNINEMP